MDDGLEVMDDGEDFSSDHDPIFYNQSLVRKRPKKFDDVWDKLKIVENFVSIKYQSKIACIFMYEKSGRPFLKINGVFADAFLVDSSPLNVNVFVNTDLQISAKLLTANRHVISEILDESSNCQLSSLIDLIVDSNRYSVCSGILQSDYDDCLGKLKKSELSDITISCFAGEIFIRGSNCNYLVDHEQSTDDICSDCQKIRTLLSERTPKKKIPQPTLEIDLPENGIEQTTELKLRPKKGRPRKEKPQESNQKASEIPLLKPMEKIENEEDKNIVQPIRRGARERKLPEFMELLKRRRGRPPVFVEPFNCNDCSMSFTSAAKYKKHQLDHSKKFTCEFEGCGRRFELLKELEIHTRKHNGERPYVCQECDRAYLSRQDLKLHQRKHTGARPFKCEVCQKSFVRLQQKKIHMTVHSGVRAFLCSECGSSFASVSTLIDHKKRRHLMVRNHHCPDCPKSFFAKSELESHAMTHTGVKPYECEDCGRRFTKLFHKKRHRGGSQPCGRPITDQLTTFIVSRGDLVGGDDTLLGLDEAFASETVFIAADTPVLEGDIGGEIHDSEFVTDSRFLTGEECTSRGSHLLLQGDIDQVRYLHLDDDLEIDPQGRPTILLQDSNIVDHSLVDIPVSEDRFVLITTDDNEQKMVPVAQIVNALHQTDHQN